MPEIAVPHRSPVPPDLSSEPWPRAIILMDMNAFFASVEQYDKPEWRVRPVAINNGLEGTCLITR